MSDITVKCRMYRMPMRVGHCIAKCGYAINGNKPCAELAHAIDEHEAIVIPMIAETPVSNAFARAFANDVQRAREFKLTGAIPAKAAKPITVPIQAVPAPAEHIVVTTEVLPAPEKENEMADPTPPAPPPAPAAEPEQLVADPAPAPAASAPLAVPAPAVAVAFPKRSKAEVLAPPPAPAPVVKPEKPPKASKKTKPEKETPMPRGIPNDPSKPRAKRAAAAPSADAMLVMVESRAGSGKFVISDGDIAKMLSLKAAGRRVLVVMQHREL